MKKVNNTICFVMIALFTSFIILGTIPVEAITKNAAAKKQFALASTYVAMAENIVKASTFSIPLAKTSVSLAQLQIKKTATYGKAYKSAVNSLTKRLNTVTLKINARVKALSISSVALQNKKYVNATKIAVIKAEMLTNTNKYNLIGNYTAFTNAKRAVAAAIAAINHLNKASREYKGYKARINYVNTKLVKIQKTKVTAAMEASAEARAEAAVLAVETASFITMVDIANLYELEKTALSAIANIKSINIAYGFTARLKVIEDKIAPIKAQLDAAVLEAITPAKLILAIAVNGSITLTFNKKPLTSISPSDFRLIKSVNGTLTNTILNSVTVVNDTIVKLNVPIISQIPNADQSVVYTVQYLTGSEISTAAYTVLKVPLPTVLYVSSPNDKTILVAYSEAMNGNVLNKPNYIIKDNNNNIVGKINSITAVSGQNYVYKLNLEYPLPRGSYTVAVFNVMNLYGYVISATSKPVTIMDTTPPLPPTAQVVEPYYKSLKVSFSETMDNTSITTKGNYQIAFDGVHYTELNLGVYIIPSSDSKSITLIFPEGTTIVPSVSILKTSGVKDLAGNYTTKVTDSNIKITGNAFVPIGVKFNTVVTVQGLAPTAGTQNVQKLTINGSFTGTSEKQVLTVNNPISPGVLEINTLSVFGGPAVNSGGLSVSFNDGIINVTINVPVTKGDTASVIGASIHSALAGVQAINTAYNMSNVSGVITLTSKAAVAHKAISITVTPITGLNPGGDFSFKQTQPQTGSAPNTTVAGNIILRINNPSGSTLRTITLPIATGLNSSEVATRITKELNNYVDVINIYSITASSNTIVILDKTVNQTVVQRALAITDTQTTLLTTSSSIEITPPSAGNGTLIAGLNGTFVTISLAPSDTTATLVAARVAAALNSDPSIGTVYNSIINGPVINITRKAAGYSTKIISLANGTAVIPTSKIVTLAAGTDGSFGINQINTITITSPPVRAGTLSIQVSDGTINQMVSTVVAGGDNTAITAFKIYSQLIGNTFITNIYNIAVSNSNIIFTKKIPGAPQKFKFVIQ